LSNQYHNRIDFAKCSKNSNTAKKYKIKTFPSILFISKKVPGGPFGDPYVYRGRWDYKQLILVAKRYQDTTTKFEKNKVNEVEKETKRLSD